MANLSAAVSDSLTLVIQLIKDIEAGGSLGKDVAAIISDPQVLASLEAVVKDVIG